MIFSTIQLSLFYFIRSNMFFILSALVPAVLIISLFYFLDKNKEPVKAVVRAFIFGLISIPITIMMYIIIPGSGSMRDGSFISALLISFWDAALHEELAKFIALLLAVYSKKFFDEWYDGIFYGVVIGVGFAFVENIQYFQDYYAKVGNDIIIDRSIWSMPLHALCGGVMGYFVGKAKFTIQENKFAGYLVLAVLAPILVHGLFNFSLLYTGIDLTWFVSVISIFMWVKVMRLKKITQETEIF